MSDSEKYCLKLEKCECGSPVLPDLSYEEQFAGYHDIDGNKVYVKTIDLGSLPTTNGATKAISVSDLNIKRMVNNVFYWIGTSNVYIGNTAHHSVNSLALYYNHVTKEITVMARGSFGPLTGTVTIYYTRTDR